MNWGWIGEAFVEESDGDAIYAYLMWRFERRVSAGFFPRLKDITKFEKIDVLQMRRRCNLFFAPHISEVIRLFTANIRVGICHSPTNIWNLFVNLKC